MYKGSIMKIIEALKKIKDLQRKADDIKEKIGQYCADLDCENPVYVDQKGQITTWLQMHSDVIKEILLLRYRIQKTNVMTEVNICIDGKYVTKTIAEWVHRRRDLAKNEESCWRKLTDKGHKESYSTQLTPNSPQNIIKRRLYFDPIERDKKIELFRSEPSLIDATLEITNAVTDLLD
jgi:hypothetical protein